MRSKTHTQKSDTKGYASYSVYRHSTRAQSAMEYLMTYGWAILIIAIVLGVLYYLGVFNSANLAPHAQPGSCHVFRPNGPGTTYDAGFSGTCQGELPEYTSMYAGSGSISVPAPMMPSGQAPRTIIAWINPSSEGSNSGIFYYGGANCNPDGAVFGLIINNGYLFLWGSCDDVSSSIQIPLDTWSFVAVNYTGSTATFFYNGDAVGNPFSYTSYACDSSDCTNSYIGGANGWWGGQFSGEIANIQVYNASLSANDIHKLYLEGIGGAPIKLQNLVGWWPLNGNAQDYSGNLNNGVPSSIAYSSSWTSGYTAP